MRLCSCLTLQAPPKPFNVTKIGDVAHCGVQDLMFNPVADLLAVALSDGSLWLWQVADRALTCVANLPSAAGITCCELLNNFS